ncbi:MAG: ribosome maturation factor RimM [Sulfurospirillaceae bacterium]|nr:ribosome maturation factor RimM [Sulfurospirillaceae bacterium]MDD3463593.1 ribosome maturation factor RimM [Sulfurospirillaceae bacterium]
MNKKVSPIEVAQIGRLVGLTGELKLHLHCDFPEQFKKGNTFFTEKNATLEVATYNKSRQTISFVGYQDRDLASKLVNALLFTSKESTLENCKLKEGEFFWFDIIGSKVFDGSQLLGIVGDIERIAISDYLVIKTDDALVSQGFTKSFYIPYIDRYIVHFDSSKKEIVTRDCTGILENS